MTFESGYLSLLFIESHWKAFFLPITIPVLWAGWAGVCAPGCPARSWWKCVFWFKRDCSQINRIELKPDKKSLFNKEIFFFWKIVVSFKLCFNECDLEEKEQLKKNIKQAAVVSTNANYGITEILSLRRNEFVISFRSIK